MDFSIHIDTISMNLSLVYFKGLPVKVPINYVFLSLKLFLSKQTECSISSGSLLFAKVPVYWYPVWKGLRLSLKHAWQVYKVTCTCRLQYLSKYDLLKTYWPTEPLHNSGLQIRACIVKLFSLSLIQNICCGYSKEPSQWDSSFQHPEHMFKLMGKKIITILC